MADTKQTLQNNTQILAELKAIKEKRKSQRAIIQKNLNNTFQALHQKLSQRQKALKKNTLKKNI